MDRVLDAGLLAVQAGSETFAEMERRTRPVWKRLAKYVARRWRQPLWSTEEDIEQELKLAAWDAIWKWDPKRGIPISSFVVYNACDKAKKRAHKCRGAKLSGNADKNPSRTEIVFSSMYSGSDPEDADRRIETLLRRESTQEYAVEQMELVDRVLAVCKNKRERAVVREAALAGLFEDTLALDPMALAECAARIYADCSTRLACRIGSEQRALYVVVNAAAEVSKRFAALAA